MVCPGNQLKQGEIIEIQVWGEISHKLFTLLGLILLNTLKPVPKWARPYL